MREGTCRSDGADLFFVEQGQGPAVLLFHGGGGTHHACLGLAAGLAHAHRVVTPDLRGSGRSWSATPLSWDILASDAAALLDHLGLESAFVGGPSMGAAVALRFALTFPRRVRGLMLLSPAYGGASLGLTDFQASQLSLMGAFGETVAREGVSALAPMYSASPAMVAYFEAIAPSLDAASFAATGAFMASHIQPFQDPAALAALTCPTLLIRGDDPMHPAAVSDALAAAIVGCEVHPPARDDAASAALIAAFVARVGG